MRLSRAGVAAAACLLLVSPASPQQQGVDCTSPASIEDPRCSKPADPQARFERESRQSPRAPVIRDEGYSQGPPPRGEYNGSYTQPSSTASVAPAAPTEFQKFVLQSTGQPLPIFGQNLFEGVPSTFAPADRVPVTPDYPIGPGDQLLVRGWGQLDLNVAPVVDRSGAVYIPQVGQVNVAGLKFLQVQEFLRTAIGRLYRNFDLSVSMGQLRSIQVFVVGRARRPGVYTVSALSTLVNAIFASGGPDLAGSMRDIRLTRGKRVVATFDLYDLLVYGDKSRDAPLLPGDVIYFPPVGPQVAMAGSLNTPAIYELRSDDTLEDALRLAGGLSPLAATRNAVIERVEDSSRRVIQVSLASRDAAATRLAGGDIVSVLAISPRFENTVTLRGNVADPVRVPWRPGMRIRDLIPDRRALLSRDYWLARNQLTPPERTRPERAGSDSPEPEGARPSDPSPQTVPVRQARMLAVKDGQSMSGPDTAAENRAGPERGTPSPIALAGVDGAAARLRLERSPLEVNWNYAVIERQDPSNLRTTLIPFRLGRAIIDGDPEENRLLEPGDIVTIFSTSDVKVPRDLQTRYVRLEGEFESAGVYSVLPGETLRQLVKRAGGLTPQAYVFGSEFRRQSTRLEQQQRLDDLVDNLERQVASSAANIRGSVVSAEEAATAASQITGQRSLVEKLRRVRATGRIVLSLDPRLPGADGLPDMQLEDGDIFVVPSRPSFVNVVGSVHNGTSFFYEPEKRLGDYLREAGGPSRTADSRSTFLIRADGSVVSKSWTNGLLTQSFEGLRLNPGDTVVVPEQINKTTFLKGLKDWSQVFSQFALGAAAINILR